MASFVIFLTAVLGLYALAHTYLYLKLIACRPLGARGRAVVLAWLGFMWISPVLGRVLGSIWEGPLPVLTLYIGYEWMALIFLFVCAQGAVDVVRGLFALAGRPWDRRTVRAGFAACAGAALIASAYGHLEAGDLRVEELEVQTSKLPPEVNELRVVQISDLHLGEINSLKEAERVAKRTALLRPDLIAATGDLVDRGSRRPDLIQAVFRKLSPPLGKYAVLGNHEFYAGVEWSVDFMERADFTVLRNLAAMPSSWLAVVGIDDPTGSERGVEPPPRARPMLSRIDEDRLVILLTHRPELEEGAPGSFDIQLSGHTHGGQIFPFGLLVSRVFPYFKGRYDAGNGSVLYVNRGAGTWGPPVRILSPPEITLIRFVRPNQ
ncbi:MAG: metallophosphoesterase [Desulfobacteraceae bacterium]